MHLVSFSTRFIAAQMLCTSFLLAQGTWSHIPFGALPSTNLMFCIAAGENNDIFLGRGGSLERFDGAQWRRIYYDTTGTGNFGQFDVRDLRFGNGCVWASTNNGLVKCLSDRSVLYSPGHTRGMLDGHLRGLALDSQGRPWFLSWLSAVSNLDLAADTVCSHALSHDVPGPFNADAAFFADARDRLWWYAGYKGIVRFENDSVTMFDSTNVPALKAAEVRNLWIDTTDDIFIVLRRGLLRCVDAGATLHCTALDPPAGMLDADEFLNLVKRDDTGSIWVTVNTDLGMGIQGHKILRVDAAGNWTRFDYPVVLGDSILAVVDFCVDHSGRVWLAAQSDGLHILTPSPTSASDDQTRSSFRRQNALRVSSNSSGTEAVIEYDIAEHERVQIAVYDLVGMTRAVLVDADRAPGRHTARLRFADYSLAPAVYFVRMMTKNGTYFGKVSAGGR
jgi:hypothetical protein